MKTSSLIIPGALDNDTVDTQPSRMPTRSAYVPSNSKLLNGNKLTKQRRSTKDLKTVGGVKSQTAVLKAYNNTQLTMNKGSHYTVPVSVGRMRMFYNT